MTSTAAPTTHATPGARAPGTRPLAWAVLAAAVVEVVAPVVTINGPGASPGAGSGPELLITPAGWAFSIWGVIYSLAIAQAVAALVRGPDRLPRRLQVDQLVLYLGGAAWIVLAGLDSSVATAVALAVMAVAGVDGAVVVARAVVAPRWLGVLTRATAGLYGGWVTAALFLNLSTAAVDLGLAGVGALGWQVGVLVVAALVLLGVTVAVRGVLAYPAAGTWALVGIAATGVTAGTTVVTVVAVAGALALAGVGVAVRASDRVAAPGSSGRPGSRPASSR